MAGELTCIQRCWVEDVDGRATPGHDDGDGPAMTETCRYATSLSAICTAFRAAPFSN